IAHLPDEVQPLLEAAAVCGMEFRAGVLATLLDRDPAWVSKRCEELAKRQLWLRHIDIVELPNGEFDSRFQFLHALYRHVFYERLAPTQRIRLHRQVVTISEASRAAGEAVTPAELASHCERGHQPIAAIRYYTEAAQYAASH